MHALLARCSWVAGTGPAMTMKKRRYKALEFVTGTAIKAS
jgi:hypothetical protein